MPTPLVDGWGGSTERVISMENGREGGVVVIVVVIVFELFKSCEHLS